MDVNMKTVCANLIVSCHFYDGDMLSTEIIRELLKLSILQPKILSVILLYNLMVNMFGHIRVQIL